MNFTQSLWEAGHGLSKDFGGELAGILMQLVPISFAFSVVTQDDEEAEF